MCGQQKTWHILGAGAIGSLWAVRLHSAGVPVRVILSQRRKKAHTGATISLRLKRNINTESEITELSEIPVSQSDDRIEQLIIATKANDVLAALGEHAHQLADGASILCLSNGMGYHETIVNRHPKCNVLAITTTEGAYIDEHACVVLAGRGQSKIAHLRAVNKRSKQNANWYAQQLSVPGHRVHARANCQRMLLDKLLINACINGLTAINSCNNGALLSNTRIRKRLNSLIDECQTIARENQQAVLAKALKEKVHAVISATAKNYSSTYTDIGNGRVSEIDFINAYLLRLAQRSKTPAPMNQAIVDDIHQLTQSTSK